MSLLCDSQCKTEAKGEQPAGVKGSHRRRRVGVRD